MGNLDAKRDWGHAKDYVNAMVDVATGHTSRLCHCYWETIFSKAVYRLGCPGFGY